MVSTIPPSRLINPHSIGPLASPVDGQSANALRPDDHAVGHAEAAPRAHDQYLPRPTGPHPEAAGFVELRSTPCRLGAAALFGPRPSPRQPQRKSPASCLSTASRQRAKRHLLRKARECPRKPELRQPKAADDLAQVVKRKEKRIVIASALGLGRAEGVTIHPRAIHGRNIRRGADWLGKHSSLGGMSTSYVFIFRRQARATVEIQPGDRLFERSAIGETPKPNVAASSLPTLFFLA